MNVPHDQPPFYSSHISRCSNWLFGFEGLTCLLNWANIGQHVERDGHCRSRRVINSNTKKWPSALKFSRLVDRCMDTFREELSNQVARLEIHFRWRSSFNLTTPTNGNGASNHYIYIYIFDMSIFDTRRERRPHWPCIWCCCCSCCISNHDAFPFHVVVVVVIDVVFGWLANARMQCVYATVADTLVMNTIIESSAMNRIV